MAVEIEAFRGFRDPQRVGLKASAVIVSGANGTGKTSLFDALQWLFVGQLPRLAAQASRHSYDVVVNRWSAGPAVVGADLRINGAPVHVRRTGNQQQTVLEWHGPDGVIRGADAETRLSRALLRHQGASLAELLLNSALLQQEAVRSLLEANPTERFSHLAALMGLDDLSRFTDAAKRRSDTLGKRAGELRRAAQSVKDQLVQLEAEAARLQERLVAQEAVEASRQTLVAALDEVAEVLQPVVGIPDQPAEASTFARAVEAFGSRCAELLARDRQLRAREQEIPPPPMSARPAPDLAKLRSALDDAAMKAREAQAALQAERERRGQVVDLASRAIPLLGDTCPVCAQAIDRGHVERHLRELIGDDGGKLAELEVAAEDTRRARAQAQERLRAAEEVQRAAEEARALAKQIGADREAWLRDMSSLRAEEGAVRTSDALDLVRGVEALEAVLDAVETLRGPAEQYARTLTGSMLSERVDRTAAEAKAARQKLGEAEQLAAAHSQRAERAKLLTAAAARAAASVADARLKQVQPLVDDIFARLDPHPAFTRLEVRLADYYRKGVAEAVTTDEAEGVEADPLLVFSSSQANVAALTWFLALSWSAGPAALPFLLLDDPLQSLDDVNVLGFADLCRRLRSRRQLIVSTHEARLARLLERKLSPRTAGTTTRHLHFRGWDRSGPVIDASEVPDQAAEGGLHVVSLT